jgi:hypothetical protein
MLRMNMFAWLIAIGAASVGVPAAAQSSIIYRYDELGRLVQVVDQTSQALTITGLRSGGFVQFGIGRAQRSNAQNGLSADLLGGATVTATLANPAATLTGTIVNKVGTGYGPGDGWGLIDAMKAIQAK